MWPGKAGRQKQTALGPRDSSDRPATPLPRARPSMASANRPDAAVRSLSPTCFQPARSTDQPVLYVNNHPPTMILELLRQSRSSGVASPRPRGPESPLTFGSVARTKMRNSSAFREKPPLLFAKRRAARGKGRSGSYRPRMERGHATLRQVARSK